MLILISIILPSLAIASRERSSRWPLKILYVGQECLGLKSCDYLNEIQSAYRSGKKEISSKSLNSAFYHARMFHIAYAVIHGYKHWDGIPWAVKIGDTFATAEGIIFAIMNLSKFSNESADDYSADWNLIALSVESSGDFIRREIGLLEPDGVITMNIGKFLPKFGELTRFDEVSTDRFDGGGAVDACPL